MLTDDPMAVAGIPQLASASATRMLWHTVADRDPDALVSQTPEWVDVVCRSGYEDATRAYWTADGSRMVLPLVRRRGNLPRSLAPLISLPSAWGVGGLLAERTPEARDIAAVLDDLRGLSAVRVMLRPNPLHAAAWEEAAQGLPFVKLARSAHVLDLQGGAQEVWDRRLPATTRGALRRTEAMELDVQVGSTPELLGDFRRLYELAVRRLADVRHEPQ